LMIHNQISHSTRRKPHCCNNHLDEQPTRSAYHRDSAASDKDQSQTSKVHNRWLCCHNHRSLASSNNDRPVSGQQPLRNNPKTISAKPSTRTGTVQRSNNSESRKGCSGEKPDKTEASHCSNQNHSPATNNNQPHSRRNRAGSHPKPVNGVTEYSMPGKLHTRDKS
jgi:hypothetical protein